MASRRTVQFRNSLEPGLTDIVAVIAYAASGNTYTLQQWQQGNFENTAKSSIRWVCIILTSR